MRVEIMRGVSGAGKSTYAGKYFPDAEVCSADHFFMNGDGEYEFNPAKLPLAHQTCFRKFLGLLAQSCNHIVVDNTNMSAWEISPYVLAGESYGYDVTIHEIKVNVNIAAGRNVHGVPLAGIQRQASNMQKLPPFWKVREV